MAKPSREPKKTKKTNDYPLAPHSLWSLIFLVFSSFFLVFDQKLQNPLENKKHPKKQHSRQATPWPGTVCGVCVIFGFLEVFFVFDHKQQIPRESEKTRLHTPFLYCYSPLNLFFFWLFLGSLDVFATFWVKTKKPRDNEKTKNKRGAVAESWVLSFCFLFLCFFNFIFWKTNSSGSLGRRFVKKNTFSLKN